MRGVPIFGELVGVRIEERTAVFGDEQEQESIDESQQGAVVVERVELAVSELLVHPSVGWVGEEPGAERLDRLLDSLAKRLEGACASVSRGLAPPLKPALFGFGGLHPGFVAVEPQQREVGVDLATQHRLEVELHVRLTGEADVVAQHAQDQAVRDDPPKPVG